MTVNCGEKFAVMLFAPLIVKSCGFVVPLKAPDQLANTHPVLAVALQETTVAESYQVPEAGVTDPLPAGFTAVVN
jgi:hypothetical protein